MARTIDNLGLDISTRYAEDRAGFDEHLIKEARLIPSQTRIDVTEPAYPTEFDSLFELGERRVSWAFFLAPPSLNSYRRRLFSEQIIPKLGSPDKQEAQIERVEAIGDQEKKKKQAEGATQSEELEVEIEKKIILNLLGKIHLFDQYLIDINSRRSQYQKG